MNKGTSLGYLLRLLRENFFTHMTIGPVEKSEKTFKISSVISELHGPTCYLIIFTFYGRICLWLQAFVGLKLIHDHKHLALPDCTVSNTAIRVIVCLHV